jgi:hypothetical protein
VWGSLPSLKCLGFAAAPSFSSSGCASFASVSIRSDTAVAGAAQCHRRLCCWLWLARAHYLRQTKAIGARRRKLGAHRMQTCHAWLKKFAVAPPAYQGTRRHDRLASAMPNRREPRQGSHCARPEPDLPIAVQSPQMSQHSVVRLASNAGALRRLPVALIPPSAMVQAIREFISGMSV